jgi:hypothetical protein
MRGDVSIPPSRDLPPSRLAQRREHLLSEIALPHSRRPLPRRGLLALAAAALIVMVGTASAIGGVRDFILDRGFIGLPPVGATPSTPENGELVVNWVGRLATDPVHGQFVRVWLYADGRIIWSRAGRGSGLIPESANELTSGYLEQRLAPEGVEVVRSELARLFELGRAHLETVADDSTPGPFPFGSPLLVPAGHSSFFGSVEVPGGDELVRLGWYGYGGPEGTPATPEQLAALRRVDVLLTDPASVLPSSSWAVRKIRAYVPSHYEVCMDTSPPKDVSQLLSLLPTHAADVLRGKSLKGSEGDLVEARGGNDLVVIGRSATYCAKLTTEEARNVAGPLSGLDQEPNSHGVILAYRLADPVGNLSPTSIRFEPYFPHGQYTRTDSG